MVNTSTTYNLYMIEKSNYEHEQTFLRSECFLLDSWIRFDSSACKLLDVMSDIGFEHNVRGVS